jgi:DNA-binding transcriptional LysR family regulator
MITTRQVIALEQGDIDVGIVRLPLQASKVALLAELSEPFCLALPTTHPLALQGTIDLSSAAQETFVGFARQRGPAFFDQTIAQCTEVGFSPQIRHEATSLYGVLNLVSAGLGIAIVPTSAGTLSAECVFRALSNPLRPGALALAHARDDPNPLLPTLAILAKEVFAELSVEIKQTIAGLA